MGIQLSLLLAPPPSAPDPREDRSEPTVWVRRLWILRELRPGDEHVVRRLDLRRGLNILWAAPTDAGVDNRLFQGRLSGHTAGKTTFCRLIRHILGEAAFATQAGRHRIRAKLPSAWVVGEVLVGGELWTAARPLGIGPHPFAVRGAPIDGVFSGCERLDYKAFIAAIEAAAVTSLPVTRFAGEDAPIRWENVLPWLSRDQESRFASFIEWRDSTSESESPMLTADDRHLLVRTMLDLISDDERAEQGKNARLVAKKQAAAERAPLLAHQAEVDDKRLAELLGIGRSKTNGPLFTGDPQALLTARRNALEATMAVAHAMNEEGADQRRATWEEAVAARLDAARDLREAEAQLEIERAVATEANHGAPPRLQLPLLGAELPPGRAFCSVPLAAARAERCPLAGVSPAEMVRRRSRKGDDDIAAATDDVLGSLELQRAHLKSALDRAGAAEKAAQRALAEAEESQRAEAARLEKERAALAQIERMLGHADATRREVEATEDELLRLEKELRRSYDRQEAFRKHHAEALGKVSDRFAYVVRALLGDAMGGRIEDDGRHLALRVDEHGDRESAAVATIKLLAFDLAALTASIEGHGAFPRFLIHDGPREADMDQTIYERLFLYAKSLEDRFRGEPGFQYILTTTAPPPRSLQRAPWLIDPILDASRADGRLLGVDL